MSSFSLPSLRVHDHVERVVAGAELAHRAAADVLALSLRSSTGIVTSGVHR